MCSEGRGEPDPGNATGHTKNRHKVTDCHQNHGDTYKTTCTILYRLQHALRRAILALLGLGLELGAALHGGLEGGEGVARRAVQVGVLV